MSNRLQQSNPAKVESSAEPRTLVESAYRNLHRDIIEGTLPPGTKLRVEHLKAELQQGSGKRIPALKQMMLDVYEFDPTILINMFHLQSSEILNNLSDELVEDIKRLTQRALESIGLILSDGIRSGEFIDLPPQTLADIIWSLFIGVVLWEESKKIVNEENDFLKPTLETAFEIFARGIRREPQHVEHAGRKEDSAKIAPGKVRQRKHQTAS